MPFTDLPPFLDVDDDRLRHLRDGREAYPAMLRAIGEATQEVLLEMYWVANDSVGIRFRDALVACARRGVAVRALYDAVGSIAIGPAWWSPLRIAGGEVVSYGPVAPWRLHFRWGQVVFRDHRKVLIVDGHIGFVGGVNLARPWLTRAEGGLDWRDDVIEVRGPTAKRMRALFAATWVRWGSALDHEAVSPPTGAVRRTFVLANHIGTRPSRRIRRAYLTAIRHARRSVDIASSYFLPGPLFLRALRAACARGVRVRLLVPKVSDVWLVSIATGHLVGRLLKDGVEVYAYTRSMLHSKTAIIDERIVTIGSHNLDTLSWRYNLECNIAVDDTTFAKGVVETFERDLNEADRLDLNRWRERPRATQLLGWLLARFRMLL